jgi:hypothetical protein
VLFFYYSELLQQKYGLENFAFVFIETTPYIKNVTEILRMEQQYIDTILPDYNIAKIAGSVLNTKWNLESKMKRKASTQFKEHLEKLRLINIGKKGISRN